MFEKKILYNKRERERERENTEGRPVCQKERKNKKKRVSR